MRVRVLVVSAVLAVSGAGVACLSHAAPAERAATPSVSAGGCPGALAGMPPFWAAVRGESVGSYRLVEVGLCPGPPRILRRLHDDVGWVASGGGVIAVVESGSATDKVALFDGRTAHPLRSLNTQGTVVTPAVSVRGDVAVVVTDYGTQTQSVQVLRRGTTTPERRYAAPRGSELSTPSWNSRGDLAVVERPDPGIAGVPNLVLLRAGSAVAEHLPIDRPNATVAMWLDDDRVALADYVAAPEARMALFDVTTRRTRLLPIGLSPVAVVPGRTALLARDPDRRLVLLSGRDLAQTTVLGDAGGALVGQGAFVVPPAGPLVRQMR